MLLRFCCWKISKQVGFGERGGGDGVVVVDGEVEMGREGLIYHASEGVLRLVFRGRTGKGRHEGGLMSE